MNRRIITGIARFMLILLFAYTAISKLAGHGMFYGQLVRFPWLSPAAGFTAWLVPVAEAAVALLLFFPATLQYGLYASCGLLVLFTVYLLWMVVFKTDLPCSCGGVIAKLSWQQHIVFNLFFIALSIGGIYFNKKPVQHQTAIKSLLQ